MGVKSYVNSIKEDLKSLKLKPKSKPLIKDSIQRKKLEIDKLLD